MAKKNAFKASGAAQPSTRPKPFCFVLMPFGPEFDDIYKLGIKSACKKAGAYCERVDEQNYEERILDRIYNQITKADIVIADMTGKNPNVFYEVGYAHALGQRTVLITQSAKDIPFDLKDHFHICYGDGGPKISLLESKLTTRLKWFVKNPRDAEHGVNNPFEIHLGAIKLFDEAQDLAYDLPPLNSKQLYGRSLALPFHVFNVSASKIHANEFQVSIRMTNGNIDTSNPGSSFEIANMPDGTSRYIIHNDKDLFIEGFWSKWIRFLLKSRDSSGKDINVGIEFAISHNSSVWRWRANLRGIPLAEDKGLPNEIRLFNLFNKGK